MGQTRVSEPLALRVEPTPGCVVSIRRMNIPDAPMHDMLFGNVKDIAAEYRNNVVDMTTEPVALVTLRSVGARLRSELAQRLTAQQRTFLIGGRNPTGACWPARMRRNSRRCAGSWRT